jgi:hypothetical protein
MFEVEGWRLKAKVKKTFCLKPQVTCLDEAFLRRLERTSNLQQSFALPLAPHGFRQKQGLNNRYVTRIKDEGKKRKVWTENEGYTLSHS